MYSSANPKAKSFEWERKCRKLALHLPHEYEGQLSKASKFDLAQRSDEQVWLVNGYLEIYDGSFRQPFGITKIADTGVAIAPYPSSAQDVQQMRESGISAVFNLLGIKEQAQLDHKRLEMLNILKERGINFSKNLPIDDTHLGSQASAEAVYLATQYLNDMINNKNCNVLIYSASGHTRATSVLIAYLHVFQKHPKWESIQGLCDYVASQHDQSLPHMELL